MRVIIDYPDVAVRPKTTRVDNILNSVSLVFDTGIELLSIIRVNDWLNLINLSTLNR